MGTPVSVIIIGGGIAGLATGCYAQMNGYRSQVFEMHSLPGGLCTSWRRQGYTFDGCLHWLVGSNPEAGSNRLWRELGVAQGRQYVHQDVFLRFEDLDGKELCLFSDPDRLEEHLLSLSPVDARRIREFTGGIRKLAGLDMPVDPPRGFAAIAAGLSMMRTLPIMQKYSQITMAEFFGGFQDPFLRTAMLRLWYMPTMPVMTPMMTFAMLHARNAGYPIGGSLSVAQAIEQRYRALGGEIHFKARVAEIIVDEATGTARGVRLADGSEQSADAIVSAADGRSTIFEMLGGRYTDAKVREPYEKWPIFQPVVQVSLGVNRDLSAMPHTTAWALERPVTVGGEARHEVGYRHFCADPTMAPRGKSVVQGSFLSNHAFWKPLAADSSRYEAEKQLAASAVIDQLERHVPGISGDIEVIDVATPLTTERITGNWQGSIQGWMLNKDTVRLAFGKGMTKTLPGLKNFYMTGQWVEPGGGVPTAAISGRNLVRTLCKQHGKKFVALEG